MTYFEKQMKISIVTITKGNPHGFITTQKSVESQTYSDFEWVVVDGDVESDNGIYDAMNKGINRARGDYLIFMNAGDEFADENTLVNISKYNADFIYGDAIEGEHLKPAKHHSQTPKGMITHHQSMVYKRSVIDDLRYDEAYAIAADYKFTIEYIRRCRSFLKLDMPICIFETGGVSQQNAKQGRLEQIKIRDELGLPNALTPYRQWAGQILKTYYPKLYCGLQKQGL
jgi:putative colanic acid biosynthesis glycosyltransferase